MRPSHSVAWGDVDRCGGGFGRRLFVPSLALRRGALGQADLESVAAGEVAAPQPVEPRLARLALAIAIAQVRGALLVEALLVVDLHRDPSSIRRSSRAAATSASSAQATPLGVLAYSVIGVGSTGTATSAARAQACV
jgi:hypothetical protein